MMIKIVVLAINIYISNNYIQYGDQKRNSQYIRFESKPVVEFHFLQSMEAEL